MEGADDLLPLADNDSKSILKSIMNDGTFDSIRLKVYEQLKQDAELKRVVHDMVASSKALQNVDVKKTNQKQVLDSIRKELEEQLLEEASRTAWSIMCSENSEVARLIDDKVHEALCSLYEANWMKAQAQYAKHAQYAAQQQQQYSAGVQYDGTAGQYGTSGMMPSTSGGGYEGGAGQYVSNGATQQQQQQHLAPHQQQQHYGPGTSGHYYDMQAYLLPALHDPAHGANTPAEGHHAGQYYAVQATTAGQAYTQPALLSGAAPPPLPLEAGAVQHSNYPHQQQWHGAQ